MELVVAQNTDSSARDDSNETLGKRIQLSDEVLIGICIFLAIGITAAFLAIIYSCKKSYNIENQIVLAPLAREPNYVEGQPIEEQHSVFGPDPNVNDATIAIGLKAQINSIISENDSAQATPLNKQGKPQFAHKVTLLLEEAELI